MKPLFHVVSREELKEGDVFRVSNGEIFRRIPDSEDPRVLRRVIRGLLSDLETCSSGAYRVGDESELIECARQELETEAAS